MKCLNCNDESVGRSKYCSAKCKVAYNRNNRNAVTVTEPTVTPKTVTIPLLIKTPEGGKPLNELPTNFGLPDFQCMMCQTNRVNNNKSTINHGTYKTADQLQLNEYNRVTLPSDVDY